MLEAAHQHRDMTQSHNSTVHRIYIRLVHTLPYRSYNRFMSQVNYIHFSTTTIYHDYLIISMSSHTRVLYGAVISDFWMWRLLWYKSRPSVSYVLHTVWWTLLLVSLPGFLDHSQAACLSKDLDLDTINTSHSKSQLYPRTFPNVLTLMLIAW